MDPLVDWPEMIGLLFLIGGFSIAMLSGNVMVLYTVCVLIGLLFGRVWYRFRLSHCIPLFMALLAFFLGFILGGFYANLRIIALLLLGGMILGYWLHKKKIIRSLEF